MNELVISIDDEERRGWLKCSYCNREDRFTYPEVGYVGGGAIPAAAWIDAHRTGQSPFSRCREAANWTTNRYKVTDWRHGDRVLKEGWINVRTIVDIE